MWIVVEEGELPFWGKRSRKFTDWGEAEKQARMLATNGRLGPVLLAPIGNFTEVPYDLEKGFLLP